MEGGGCLGVSAIVECREMMVRGKERQSAARRDGRVGTRRTWTTLRKPQDSLHSGIQLLGYI